MYGRINLNTIDTQPGAGNAFSPPAGFNGNYRQFINQRVKADPGVRQHIAIVALKFRREQTPPAFHGQYANEAQAFARAVLRKLIAASAALREKQDDDES
ncbi:hypothetical protein [Simplicispira suum]|uniref:Uncharacterized protein n=1 Tax=Simplicispira suum TaxID=2109915 RepID=A0A2S0N670_9BURK|nr:hypothetical protein [Simplicispira suum]AVO43471.1 hypothetical protein C6571_18775 [Simplicispira suum]